MSYLHHPKIPVMVIAEYIEHAINATQLLKTIKSDYPTLSHADIKRAVEYFTTELMLQPNEIRRSHELLRLL